MKHLLTAIACCLAVAGSAQMPYNPDSNLDGIVGTADLMAFLAFFGQGFSTSIDDFGPGTEIEIIDSVNFTQESYSWGLRLNSDTIVMSEDTDLLLLDALALGLDDLHDSIPYDECLINVLLPSDSTVTKLLYVGAVSSMEVLTASQFATNAIMFHSSLSGDTNPLPFLSLTYFNAIRTYYRAQGEWFMNAY